MRRIIISLLPLILIGCVTIKIPEQIKEEFPYKRVFNASFDNSIRAGADALEDLGWKVAYISRSKLIKKDRTLDKEPKYQAYIFTEIRQVQLFLTSSYSTFNVRAEALADGNTEISIRYLSITPIPPFYKKKFNYRNDKLIERLYKNIESNLNKTELLPVRETSGS